MGIKTSEILLNKVLQTCRAKSSQPLVEWLSLKSEIANFLNGNNVNISGINVQEKLVQKTVYKKVLPEKWRELKSDLAKAEALIRIYRERERDISRVLKSRIKQ